MVEAAAHLWSRASVRSIIAVPTTSSFCFRLILHPRSATIIDLHSNRRFPYFHWSLFGDLVGMLLEGTFVFLRCSYGKKRKIGRAQDEIILSRNLVHVTLPLAAICNGPGVIAPAAIHMPRSLMRLQCPGAPPLFCGPAQQYNIRTQHVGRSTWQTYFEDGV